MKDDIATRSEAIALELQHHIPALRAISDSMKRAAKPCIPDPGEPTDILQRIVQLVDDSLDVMLKAAALAAAVNELIALLRK